MPFIDGHCAGGHTALPVPLLSVTSTSSCRSNYERCEKIRLIRPLANLPTRESVDIKKKKILFFISHKFPRPSVRSSASSWEYSIAAIQMTSTFSFFKAASRWSKNHKFVSTPLYYTYFTILCVHIYMYSNKRPSLLSFYSIFGIFVFYRWDFSYENYLLQLPFTTMSIKNIDYIYNFKVQLCYIDFLELHSNCTES